MGWCFRVEEQRGKFRESLLIALPGRDNRANFGVPDQRKSTRQCSREGSEGGARCIGLEHVPRWIWERDVSS